MSKSQRNLLAVAKTEPAEVVLIHSWCRQNMRAVHRDALTSARWKAASKAVQKRVADHDDLGDTTNLLAKWGPPQVIAR